MPRKPINYSKTTIYKIVPNDKNLNTIYIGHTTNFANRKNGHKTTCNNPNAKGYNRKVYIKIRENGGWDNFTMLEIEKFSCNDGNEARQRERYWFDVFNPVLNSNRMMVTMEEKQESIKIYECGDRRKELNKKRQETDKYKEYINSVEHKERRKEYRKSDIGKEQKKKYEQSDKCKETKKQYELKRRGTRNESRKQYMLEYREKQRKNQEERNITNMNNINVKYKFLTVK